jgi:Ca2+-binding EF-hand superfamily protein
MMGSRSPRPTTMGSDALSRLPPVQLRDMREAFQALDRDNDGTVNRDDVADVLSNLGTFAPGILPPGQFSPRITYAVSSQADRVE